MELTILGCWAPYPRPGGACSGYLIRAGGLAVMLEAGSGSLSNLLKFIDFRKLDAVVISHLHHDHFVDLFQLRHAFEGARRAGTMESPVKLFIPSEPADEYLKLAGYGKAFAAVPIESLGQERLEEFDVRRLDLGRLVFRFAPARHSLPGYSISIEEKGRLVFSGDTALTGELLALARGADLFLCEASGTDGDADYLKDAHLTARQAGEAAREAGVGRLLVTHLWPEYDPAEICRQAAGAFGGKVSAAREGETHAV